MPLSKRMGTLKWAPGTPNVAYRLGIYMVDDNNGDLLSQHLDEAHENPAWRKTTLS